MSQQEIYSRIAKKLVPSISEADLIYPVGFVSKKNPVPISKNNFHPLPLAQSGLVIFIDGGEGVCLLNSAQVIGVVRIAAVGYEPKRVFHETISYLVSILFDAGANAYRISLESLEQNTISSTSFFVPQSFFPISLDDDQLRGRASAVQPISVLSFVRRSLELQFAAFFVERHAKMILLDGSFDTHTSFEKDLLARLREQCKENSILCAAFSKTTSLLTTSSLPLGEVLLQKAPSATWWYGPLCEEIMTSHAMVRLHPSSRFAFRLDSEQSKIDACVSLLALHCTDPTFFGYPYGLVEADMLARVSDQELQQHRLRLEVALTQAGISIDMLETQKAHSLLDHLKF